MSRMVTLGWQFTCVQAMNDTCNDPEPAFEDAWQNPEDEDRLKRAAQAHADRTGHIAYIERHQRMAFLPKSPKGDSGRFPIEDFTPTFSPDTIKRVLAALDDGPTIVCPRHLKMGEAATYVGNAGEAPPCRCGLSDSNLEERA